MNKLLVVFGLALMADAVFGGAGLVVKFGTGLGIGIDFFYSMPYTRDMALKAGWKKYERVTTDRPLLTDMYCEESLTCCLLVDDNGFAGGFQTAYDASKFTGALFDWEVQGYTSWTVEVDGVEKTYWAITQYFVSDEYLESDKDSRQKSYDKSTLLQEPYVWYTGFNGELYQVPVKGDQIPRVGFTQQSCLPWMGHHFFWNMTKNTECTSESIFPYFPLVKSNKLIGAGTITAGLMNYAPKERDYTERFDRGATQLMVNKGPQCLYDLADKPGLTTMHVYYIDDPYFISCILQ